MEIALVAAVVVALFAGSWLERERRAFASTMKTIWAFMVGVVVGFVVGWPF